VFFVSSNSGEGGEGQGGLPTGLAVQSSERRLFWTDVAAGAIFSTDTVDGGNVNPGGKVETLVTGLSHPLKIAVSLEESADAEGPHLFWSDPVEGKLYRASVDGTDAVAMVSGVSGISGVTTTYDYVYFTVPSANTIYRVGFDYVEGDYSENTGIDSSSAPAEVLLSVCEGPSDLYYSPQALVMYCACSDSVVGVAMHKQQGGYDHPLHEVLSTTTTTNRNGKEALQSALGSSSSGGQGLNAVLYNWDAGGLYVSSFNASSLHFLPMDGAYGSSGGLLEVVGNGGGSSGGGGSLHPRGVALFDPSLEQAGSLSRTAQALLKDPALVFAAPDDDGSLPLTAARTVLPLSGGAAAAKSSGSNPPASAAAAAARQAMLSEKDAAGASSAGPSPPSNPKSAALFAAGAGAFAVFALLALGGRGRRPGEEGNKGGFLPRAGYSALE